MKVYDSSIVPCTTGDRPSDVFVLDEVISGQVGAVSQLGLPVLRPRPGIAFALGTGPMPCLESDIPAAPPSMHHMHGELASHDRGAMRDHNAVDEHHHADFEP